MVWLLSIQADDQDIFGGSVPLLMLSLLAMMQLQHPTLNVDPTKKSPAEGAGLYVDSEPEKF